MISRAWDDLLRRYPQLPLVARRMLYEVPDSIQPMAHLLAGLRTPEAIETLREFVGGQKGSHEDRVQVLRIMQQAGVLPPDAEVEMWVDGERHPIQSMLQEISDEFVPDYRPEVWELYDRALTAHHKGRIAEAERLYEAMLKAEPKAKEAYNNLASIYHQRGDIAALMSTWTKRWRSIRSILSRSPAAHPRHWARGLGGCQGVAGTVASRAAVAPARLRRLSEGHGPYRRSKKGTTKPRGNTWIWPSSLSKTIPRSRSCSTGSRVEDDLSSDFGDWWQDYDEQSRQRRVRRALPADPSLADCLHVLSKGDMDGIAGVVGLRLRSPYKRADIEGHLLARFPDPDFLADVVGGLNAAERAALGDLLAHGGVMDREAFIQAHGDEGDDRPYLEYHGANMKSVKGRLRARGLLFEGTADGRLIVATPGELRSPLRNALARGDQNEE